MVFDDALTREPEDWQLAVAEDIFAGTTEIWMIVPEGNGKTTFLAQLGLYGLDYSHSPWIPVGAASRDQARIVYSQAAGFIERTPGLSGRFRAFDGYRKVKSLRNGGEGLQVYAADPKTGDGVIPYPYAIIDELHRHNDLRLYSLWKGKLRKRGGQILTISTAGEPGTPFEETREAIRRRATDRHREGSFLRATGPNLVMHEYMVQSEDLCGDMAAVKSANPLDVITEQTLANEYASPTLDLGEWKRLKCNRPTRSVQTAITDLEWEAAEIDAEIPAGEHVDAGLDVAWKWDTTAVAPLWKAPEYRLLGPASILVPPRDGSTLHPDEIKEAFETLNDRNPIDTVVMDMSKAEDVSAWLEDDLGVTVIDAEQGNHWQVLYYEAFMEGLRAGTLKHTGHPGLRAHVLNAISRRLPGGDHRFDRPSQSRRSPRDQDRRVIDALTAASMVVELSTRAAEPERRSVYEDRSLAVV